VVRRGRVTKVCVHGAGVRFVARVVPVALDGLEQAVGGVAHGRER